MHSVGGVRPIAFDRDCGEILLLDEAARDSSALTVEVVGPVRRFADQYESCVAYGSEQRIVFSSVSEGERLCASGDLRERPAGVEEPSHRSP